MRGSRGYPKSSFTRADFMVVQSLCDFLSQLTGVQVPFPVVAAVLVFLVHTLIILDVGAEPNLLPIFATTHAAIQAIAPLQPPCLQILILAGA